jgi:hypothetical protein
VFVCLVQKKKTEGDCVFVFCFVFVWKFVQNWMPTKDNLVNRRIIGEDSQLCCAGFDSIESGVYIVFECSAFSWVESSKMVWSGGCISNEASSHLCNFTGSV